jgi:hypothetical protein
MVSVADALDQLDLWKASHGFARETWLPVISDSFRLSSNEPIFKAARRRKQGLKLRGRVIACALERPFSHLAF